MGCSPCKTESLKEDAPCYLCGKAPEEYVDNRNGLALDGEPSQPKYASWIRIVSHVIDTTLFLAFCTVLGVLLGAVDLADRMDDNDAAVVAYVLSWLYFAFQESSSAQATLGKRVVGIVVTDLKGHRISFLRATGRYFAKFLSGILFAAGYIMIPLSKKKEGLHDCLAGTYVVYKDGRKTAV